MKEYPHGTVFIFKTKGTLPAPVPKGDELGVRMIFIGSEAELIAAVQPEGVTIDCARPLTEEQFFGLMAEGIERASDECGDEPVKVPDDFVRAVQEVSCRYGFGPVSIAAMDSLYSAVKPSIGFSLGVAPVTDTDAEKFPVVPDDVRKRAEWAADMVGVTKYSDMRVHVVQAAICALMNDDRQYTIGDQTMKKVFEPVGMVNLANLQWFLDVVEAALQPKPAAEPEKQLSAIQLHREAIALLSLAEKHAEAIQTLPTGFESESRDVMVNEYFEHERKAISASRKTDIEAELIPDHDGPRIWNDRSMWHYKLKGRHASILRTLTDQ